MELLSPTATPDMYKTAIIEIAQEIPLAFQKGSFFRDEVLAEQNTD